MAFALELAGFLATIAFARFVQAHRKQDDDHNYRSRRNMIDALQNHLAAALILAGSGFAGQGSAWRRLSFAGSFRVR